MKRHTTPLLHPRALRARLLLPIALAALCALLLAPSIALAASGGPDTFGYTWRDSGEPGVVYSWEDVAAIGTDIGVDGDDVNYGFRPLSFLMPYYGGAYNRVAACSNGWVSLVDATSQSYINGNLPTAGGPMGIIAAFWDDLRYTTGTSKVIFADLGDHAVITFSRVHDLGDLAAVNTFQVILHVDGRIVVQYQSLLGDRTSCTLGIESPDELHGLTVYNDLAAGVPASNYRVEFLPPVPLPMNLDCAGATVVTCGARLSGDLMTGAANQNQYRCSLADYSGRERVYRLDLAAPTDLRVIMEATSGNPDLLLVANCDPNACQVGAGDAFNFVGVSGTLYFVVDSRPGEEGTYNLRFECLPLPNMLDCLGVIPIACDERVTGDTAATGTARQHAYLCSQQDFSGRELVYRLDLPFTQTVRATLTVTSGSPRLIVLDGCNPNACLAMPGTSAIIDPASGSLFFVVDSAPGQEGAFELFVECIAIGDSFPFCTATFESDPWNNGNGSWLVRNWFYHPADTHSYALRVDGGAATYTQDADCTRFPSVFFGSQLPDGPGFVEWGAPEGQVVMTMSETRYSGCCGLLVESTVTNTDSVPHDYEFRVYHDTAFGNGDGTCRAAGLAVDGGPVEVNGTRYMNELDLLANGGTTCEGQLQMFSGEHPNTLWSSYEMLGPNFPTAYEFLDWPDGGAPCTTWSGLVDNEATGGCQDDNSVLIIWRFPATSGQLAPGESATARYRIGYQCAFPCVGCEDPFLTTGSGTDLAGCNSGIQLTWAPATFPGGGAGVYNVYRSTVSFVDALAQPPIATNIAPATWVDGSTITDTPYFYVVQAESLDFPGCGTGPVVAGSTDEINIGPLTDLADVSGPVDLVGNSLRATAHTDDTVDFNWFLAPPQVSGEHYIVLRSDNLPQGPFSVAATVPGQSWTDPAAPPRFAPAHVWFYDVRIGDDCGNISLD